MKRGGKIIGTAAMFSVAACGGEQGKLEIRPIKAPLAAGYKAVPFRIAEARGQFALGNVALALEAFRIALREDPNSIDAMTGVAACYDRMARFDLSRRHYEAALAIAPGDPQLLTAFAASLDLQGRAAEAASVRQEIKQRVALAQNAAPEPAPVAVQAAPPKPATPAALPPPPAVAVASRAEAVRQAAPAVRPSPTATAPVAPAAPFKIAQAPSARVAPPAPTTTTPPIGRSVTVVLPPARAVPAAQPVAPKVDRAVSVALASAAPLPAAPPNKPAAERATAATQPMPVTKPLPAAPPARPATDSAVVVARTERDSAGLKVKTMSGPRIERLSLREVELITAPGPQWRALTVGRTQRSATVRFIPLRQAAMRPAGVRVLNAARVDRLAARTRMYLADRGWRAISIGDAPAIRMRSVILYPADKRRMAQRLSAQFGFVIAQRPGARQVTILLGRDAARNSALRARI